MHGYGNVTSPSPCRAPDRMVGSGQNVICPRRGLPGPPMEPVQPAGPRGASLRSAPGSVCARSERCPASGDFLRFPLSSSLLSGGPVPRAVMGMGPSFRTFPLYVSVSTREFLNFIFQSNCLFHISTNTWSPSCFLFIACPCFVDVSPPKAIAVGFFWPTLTVPVSLNLELGR